MAKKFYYRGKTLEELNAMSLNEFAELLPSKERRKVKRGFTDEEKKFLKKVGAKDNVRTHCRTMLIIPVMVGKIVHVHRGDGFVPVHISEEMIGHRLGEFVMTRKKLAHSAPGVGATRSSASVSVR